MSTVGVVGLGDLGSAVAARLVASGYDVTGYDPDPGRASAAEAYGVRVASSPADVAQASTEVVVLLVKTQEHADRACFGPDGCSGALAGKVLMVMSTLDPGYLRRLAAAAAARGGWLADVPSGGGAPAALTGKLSLLASGPAEAISRVKPVLDRLGSTTIIGTEPGMAQAAKLITQVAFSVNLTVLVEAVKLGERYGFDAHVLMPVIAESSGGSFVASNWSFLLDFIKETHVANVAKDLTTLLGDLPDPAMVPVTQAVAAALRSTWPAGSRYRTTA